MDCSRIRELDIPATVTDIGAEAFAGCSRVVTVSSRAKKAPNTYNSSFGTSTLDYTGNQADGTRKLRVLTVSSGYGSGGWKVLVSSAGFKKTSVTRF